MTLWNNMKTEIDQYLLEFSSSIDDDIHLFHEDIACSIAHAKMLQKIDILDAKEYASIKNGLEEIRNLYKKGEWIPEKTEFEDIHSAIEIKLTELIGEPAEKLHTGRSRNDQIATDMNLWMIKKVSDLKKALFTLQQSLLKRSKEFKETIIPGYTHLQHAQPITLGYHLLTYIEMFERDKERLQYVVRKARISPLGSSAISGSTINLDRKMTAYDLGFDTVSNHAMDTISNRDHHLDFLNSISITMLHLSRLCEEMILWCSSEWNWIKLKEEFTTGSSLMPNKRNPDFLELIRGKVGRCTGNQISLMMTLKSLPLAYNRDLQEDKRPIMDSYQTLKDSLIIMNEIILSFDLIKTDTIQNDHLLATDLADRLVEQGIAFRQVHGIVRNIVKKAQKDNRNISSYSKEDLNKEIGQNVDIDFSTINESLKNKKTKGSCSPFEIEQLIQNHEQMFGV